MIERQKDSEPENQREGARDSVPWSRCLTPFASLAAFGASMVIVPTIISNDNDDDYDANEVDDDEDDGDDDDDDDYDDDDDDDEYDDDDGDDDDDDDEDDEDDDDFHILF